MLDARYFSIGTWNPYTWKSPWPYTEYKARRIVTSYRLARADCDKCNGRLPNNSK